jgi:exopolyphosphatase/guanosine-5'-triphosphate,3'-diphosphate pyrophosphatase
MAQTGAADCRQATDEGRVAVIDIGSNSIRLEIFDGLTRAFCPLFNEKVICGLGRGLKSTGRLSEEGAEMALVNLPRFTRMARGMGVA